MSFIGKLKFLLLLFFPYFLWSEIPYSIVCVHIGEKLPLYLEITLAQTRLFNEKCPVVLLTSANALKEFYPRSDITLIPLEFLPVTVEHERFRGETKLKEGYMRYTSERFLYLYDYMLAFDVKNVFHIENDVLLYLGKEIKKTDYLPMISKRFLLDEDLL